ncbi:MAG: hypothetical protein IPJ65_23275 [Archangiaceae bacterium]|nr:hypothetical protein [Archangiaceae bacterium]
MSRLVLIACFLCGCRTNILAEHMPPPANIFKAPERGCSVNDFPAATDVPEGSTNLGWVQVPKEASDEETYVKLREAICEKGGNGLSQLHWVNETTKDAPFVFALEANAWQLPDEAVGR